MEKFLSVVIGDMDAGAFLGYFALALIGSVGVVLYRANKKAEEAAGTPEKFSWIFFFRHNFNKWLLQLFTIGLMIRFSNETIGQELTGWGAVLIGMASGQFSIWGRGREDAAVEKLKE